MRRAAVVGTALGVGAAALAVRWLRRRAEPAPFPAWLAWWLDNPLSHRLLGTGATLDHLELAPGMRVLEIGPGPGRLLIPAARRIMPGGEAVGLDIQRGMVERLRQRAAAAELLNVTVQVGDAASLPYPSGSFDLVWLCAVLGEIADQEAALAECFRVLRPGGRLAVAEGLPDPHHQTLSEVRRIAEPQGFRFGAARRGRWRYTALFARPGA